MGCSKPGTNQLFIQQSPQAKVLEDENLLKTKRFKISITSHILAISVALRWTVWKKSNSDVHRDYPSQIYVLTKKDQNKNFHQNHSPDSYIVDTLHSGHFDPLNSCANLQLAADAENSVTL